VTRYGVIFALFAQYFFDIPETFTMRPFNFVTLTDKHAVYLLALQLTWAAGGGTTAGNGAAAAATAAASSSWTSWWLSGPLVSLSGIAAGLLYRSDFAGMKKWRFGPSAVKFASTVFGPLLDSSSSPPRAPTGAGANPGGNARGYLGRSAEFEAGVPGGSSGAATTYARMSSARAASASAPVAPVNEEHVSSLEAMGFPRENAIRALQETGGNLVAATNRLLDSGAA
jgi:hypothetical protein